MWAALYFLLLAISAARSDLGIADYGPPLILAVVLFSAGTFVGAKVRLRKRDQWEWKEASTDPRVMALDLAYGAEGTIVVGQPVGEREAAN